VFRVSRAKLTQRGQRGATLLEYAIVVVLMLTFLFGIVDLARALYAYHFVANAAREATRFAMVRGTTWVDPGPAPRLCSYSSDPSAGFPPGCQAMSADIQLFVQTEANGIGLNDSNAITATLTSLPSPNGSSANCAGPPISPGCTAQVTVQYPFKFIMPFLPTSASTCNSVAASICMTSTSEMIVTQ